MAISKEEFRASLGRFASGVTVVTTQDGSGKPFGMTVSAFSSLSMDPPLVLVCIQKNGGSYHTFDSCKRFVVNILADHQQQLSNHFASRLEDKFAGISYKPGIDGIPILDNCLANLECCLKSAYDGGDHTIFVGEVERVLYADKRPLVYWQGNYREMT